MAHANDDRTRYEAEDANVREVVLAGVGLVIGTVIVLLLMWGLFNALKRNQASVQTVNPLASPQQLPPDPRLQVNPSTELNNLRRHEDEVLKTYGWVDKSAGKVRVPADRAMGILLQRGFPVRGGGANAANR